MLRRLSSFPGDTWRVSGAEEHPGAEWIELPMAWFAAHGGVNGGFQRARSNGYIESFNNRLRKECLNCNHWNTLLEVPAWSSATSSENITIDRYSALGYRTPAEYAAVIALVKGPQVCSPKFPTCERGQRIGWRVAVVVRRRVSAAAWWSRSR